MKKTRKHPEDMTAAELVAATKAFDKSFIFEKARPLNRAERAQERRLRRGRPRIGKGSKKISVSIESGLLKKADTYARKNGVNRSKLITDFVVDGLARRAS
jgi:hypothetical protein